MSTSPFARPNVPIVISIPLLIKPLWTGFSTALKQEAVLYKKIFREFDSLYFGGGTPSLIDEKGFAEIFTALRTQFTFSPDTEITVEMNPDDVTAEKLESLQETRHKQDQPREYSRSTIKNLPF